MSILCVLQRNKNIVKYFGEGGIDLEQSRLPFEIHVEHIEPFIHSEAGFNYSYAGIRFKFRRHDLGLLLGGYFGPTIVFAILSLVSFFINPDVVSTGGGNFFGIIYKRILEVCKQSLEVCSSHLYASFGTFCVQIGQLFRAQ